MSVRMEKRRLEMEETFAKWKQKPRMDANGAICAPGRRTLHTLHKGIYRSKYWPAYCVQKQANARRLGVAS